MKENNEITNVMEYCETARLSYWFIYLHLNLLDN